ncbi:exported hypothetical protein [Verrucomicrobia bacterium]|nr:exported hypothetical protein [Verrucomicrobiota bacterium]
MKLSHIAKLLVASVAFLALTSNSRANVEVFFAGGNASQNVLYDRVTNIFGGGSTLTSVVVSSTNSTVRTYQGTIPGQSGLGTVTIDFSLVGAVQGLEDLSSQNNEGTALGSNLPPTVAVSSTTPEAVGINSSPFTEEKTLVVPFVYVKPSASKAPNLAGITNLTQQQAYYLESAAGTLPSGYFGGSSTSDVLYLVPRNTSSAVRTETDLNIGFSGTIAAWTTNQASFSAFGPPYSTSPIGAPVPDPNGGQSSGGSVRSVVAALTNAIGTVAAQDISTLIPLSYNGVPFSIANVENGSYSIWSYEHWYYPQTGQPGAPSPNQLLVINTLLRAVTNAAFQATSPVVVGNFAPYGALQVQRLQDGGPITSLLY